MVVINYQEQIQGYNGVATVYKKRQIIIGAQVFGEVQKHHTLKPVLETVQQRYKKTGYRRQRLSKRRGCFSATTVRRSTANYGQLAE